MKQIRRAGDHAGVFVRLAQDDIGFRGILRGNLVENQHSIVAAVGDEQARSVGEREAPDN